MKSSSKEGSKVEEEVETGELLKMEPLGWGFTVGLRHVLKEGAELIGRAVNDNQQRYDARAIPVASE